MSMLTEDEAKTKWCPWVRFVTPSAEDNAPRNRLSAEYPERIEDWNRCIGSACMMWRWTEKPNPDWKPDSPMPWYPQEHPDDKPALYIEDKTRGYCGLAGKP